MDLKMLRLVAGLALLDLAVAQDARQSLKSSIEEYPELSIFASILDAAPRSLQNVVQAKSENITVMIPNNDAITSYFTSNGVSSVGDLESEDVETFLSYHVLVASLKSADFDDKPRGQVIPTLLRDEQYNNRTAGPQLRQSYGEDATGQVLFALQNQRNSKRQNENPSVTLRGGLGQDVQMTTVDGEWGPDNVNTFQIVDSVLTPPNTCSTTIRSGEESDQLGALDTALNRTQLWSTLDFTPNVTCLAPSTEAFKKAGDPQDSLSKEDLTGALLAHTLKEVTYSNYLEDGQILETYNGTRVRISIKDDEIYFNNAKVIEANVLTNNGLLHVLDAVIEPLEEDDDDDSEPTGTSGTATSGTASATTSPTTLETNDAMALKYSGLLAIAAGLVMI